MILESRFSIGMASSRSSPLPCGTPSIMSMSTTSASSLAAIQWAAVAPTLPEPTIVTFLRMHESFPNQQSANQHSVLPQVATASRKTDFWLRSDDQRLVTECCVLNAASHQHRRAHVLNDVRGEFAGLYLGRTFHEPFKVVGNFFLLDGTFHALLDQVGRLIPAQEAKHHYAGQDYRSGVNHIFVCV